MNKSITKKRGESPERSNYATGTAINGTTIQSIIEYKYRKYLRIKKYSIKSISGK
jgi:hypothetical protein